MAVKRKKKEFLVATRITAELYQWVKLRAEAEDISMGAILRRALRVARMQRGRAA